MFVVLNGKVLLEWEVESNKSEFGESIQDKPHQKLVFYITLKFIKIELYRINFFGKNIDNIYLEKKNLLIQAIQYYKGIISNLLNYLTSLILKRTNKTLLGS